MQSYNRLAQIAEIEFADVVLTWGIYRGKLRLFLSEGSFIDVWFSQRLKGRFAYHWERRGIYGGVYRLDNRPHEELKGMKGFPAHFHNGSDQIVGESSFSEDREEALREFLRFVKERIDF